MVTTWLQCMAGIGMVFILYGAVLLFVPSPTSVEVREFLRVIQQVADWVSVLLTLAGVFLVALSGYFLPYPRDPDRHSLKYVAPAVMLATVGAVVTMVWLRTPLNQPMILGFAILGLSGSTLKALPFSEMQSRTYGRSLFRPWPWWRTNGHSDEKGAQERSS